MSKDQKRTKLRTKIEAGERRNADKSLTDYARDARDGATSFVKEHPIATLAGGLALGVLVAAVVPGPGRRLRRTASARGTALAGVLAELGLAYGTQLLDGAGKAARAGHERIGELGDTLGDGALNLRREAGSKTTRAIRELRSRLPH